MSTPNPDDALAIVCEATRSQPFRRNRMNPKNPLNFHVRLELATLAAACLPTALALEEPGQGDIGRIVQVCTRALWMAKLLLDPLEEEDEEKP